MEATLVIAIIQAVLTYGPKAVITISNAMQSEGEIDASDIKELFIDKEPADYF